MFCFNHQVNSANLFRITRTDMHFHRGNIKAGKVKGIYIP